MSSFCQLCVFLTSETPCSVTMAFLHVQLLNLIVEVMAGCGLRLVAVAVLSSSCGRVYYVARERK